METWDAYLANGQKTGRILTRGQSIPDDLYHLAVDCLVQHVDNDILFVQRHLEKEAFPGFLKLVQVALLFMVRILNKLFDVSCWKKLGFYQLN